MRKGTQLEALGSWVEKTGCEVEGEEAKDEFVNPWPWFAACGSLPYTVPPFPHQCVGASEQL